MNALKRFGLGLLWIFLIPFILLGIAVVGVFGILNFPIQLVIMIVNFFRGKKLFPLFEEDERAMAILKRAIDKANGEAEAAKAAPAPQQVFVQQNYYSNAPLPPQPNGIPYGANPNMSYPGGQIPYGNPNMPYQGIPGQQPNPYPLPQQAPNPQPNPYSLPQAPLQQQGPAIPVQPYPEQAPANVPPLELSSLPSYDEKKEDGQ